VGRDFEIRGEGLARLGSSLVGVFVISGDSVIFDVVEGVVHKSSIASSVSVR